MSPIPFAVLVENLNPTVLIEPCINARLMLSKISRSDFLGDSETSELKDSSILQV